MVNQPTAQLRPARRRVPATRGNLFTDKEQADLRRLYPSATWPELLAAASGRTRRHIIAWAENQGIRRETPQAKRLAAQRGATTEPKRRQRGEKKREVATPVLNARVSERSKRNEPTQLGQMLEQLRKLPGAHPRRLAYAQAARSGTGLDAYQAFMNWKPTQEGGQSR